MRLSILRSAAAIALIFGSSAVMAQTMPLAVSASVAGVCQLQSVGSMSFTLDPSVGGDATDTASVSYKCTKGTTSVAVTLAGAGSPFSGSMASAATPANTIPFSVAWTNPVAAGAGFNQAAQSVTLTGTVTEANYLDAVAASDYAASVTVAINP